MTKKDGGAAFPVQLDYSARGTTLRDWLDGQALVGQLSFSPRDSFDKYNRPDDVAAMAYKFADAMLKEREK